MWPKPREWRGCSDSRSEPNFEAIPGASKKTYYRIGDPATKLLISKALSNLKAIAGIRSQSRNAVVAGLLSYLKENCPYRIYRLDISSFYESVDQGRLGILLNQVDRLHAPSRQLLLQVLDSIKSICPEGIPRGLNCSAVFASLYLKEFDECCRSLPNVYFYGRFVDDIVIITTGEEKISAFESIIRAKLPTGLLFNLKKSRRIDCLKDKAIDPLDNEKPKHLIYLGYEIEIPILSKKEEFRALRINIAPSKIRKIKTRMVLAFRSYIINRDWSLLWMRLRFLTGNYFVKDRLSGRLRVSGIYYNYRFCDADSISLNSLDESLRSFVSRRRGRALAGLIGALSRSQYLKISGIGFRDGFVKRTMIKFTAKEFDKIKGCWRNV